MNVKQFREEREISGKEAVKVIKSCYPGYTKVLQSQVEKPDKYGIRLLSEAEQLLKDSFPTLPNKAAKPDRHRLKHRLSCRLRTREYEQFKLVISRNGYESVQDALKDLVLEYIKNDALARQSKKRHSENTLKQSLSEEEQEVNV